MKKNDKIVIISNILAESAPESVIKNFENTVRKSLPWFSEFEFNFLHRKIHTNLDKVKTPTTAFFIDSRVDENSMNGGGSFTVAVQKIKGIKTINELETELKRFNLQEKEEFESLSAREKFEKKWGPRLFDKNK